MTAGQSLYLDALRAVAAHLVLVGHILSLAIFPELRTGLGDFGVVIFFILSGFLVASTSARKADKHGYRFRDYMLDRACRIFVPFVPALLLVAVLDGAVLTFTTDRTYAEYYTVKDFVANLSMLQQFPPGILADQLLGLEAAKLSTFGSARPFWTVASEWWLYVCFGIIFFAVIRRAPVSGTVFLLFAAIFPMFNFVAGTGEGLSLLWLFMALSGVWYARHRTEFETSVQRICLRTGTRKFLTCLALFTLLGLVVVRVVWVSFLSPGRAAGHLVFYDFSLYVLLALACGLAFVLVTNSKPGATTRGIRFLADYSYSLYLIHYTVIYACLSFDLLPRSGVLTFVFLYAVTNLVAAGLWFGFERNHKKVRALFAPQPRGADI